MEKAYDRLEWKYIFITLEKLGFCARWVDWLRQCITTVSFSVLVNGIPGETFVPQRGIRQGDPLSPYIFILCAEILARQLQHASLMGSRSLGVTLGHSGVRIPFLTFADDTMIFAKASEESCITIKAILDKYCNMSGQLINFHKSAFQCTQNVSDNVSAKFAEILQMDESFSLGKYLGCPIIDSKVTNATFADIQEKVCSQLTKWKANSLSQAGRTILVQSNLATKANYQMQSFSLPPAILSSLDKCYRNFFWNKASDAKSPNLIGWDKICSPKKFGGLGLRKAKANNNALQFKLLWKILESPDNLWVQLVTRKYLKDVDLFNYKVKANVSWQWRRLMRLRSSFKKGLRWIVGNGDQISFWFDNWIFSTNLAEKCLVPRGSEALKVSFFINQDGHWNVDLLRQYVPADIASLIANYYLPSNVCRDKRIWGPTPDGIYSVKSGVELLQGLNHQICAPSPFGWIWKLSIPPKIKFFLWKVCHNGIPTKKSGQAAFGFVIRDAEGVVKLCGAGTLDGSVSILEAEARGLREGIRGAKSLGIDKLIVEGDNLAVINAVKRVWKIPWKIHSAILDTIQELGHFTEVQIDHVFREANAAADWMAHRGHTTLSTTYWFDVSDLSFSVIIRKDALGWPKSWDPP
ncbi:uncharacterized protein LOC130590283 [Beta vulgaris subsp. vulgaris]|uniref:uncharacterized protein LOC130590283 n=1 Tax=Beta vulgaris subsp. vulgaris TaxID=3555 RepID=UPI00254794B7|nr:uncharacterized protein LOC130590283 [Beta vulgaris subsp. vulgaris]